MKNDLISRKALLTVPNVRKVTEFDETGEWITYLAVPVDAIEKAPTIEAEPVRHGRWIDKGLEGDFSWRLDGRGSCWRVLECSSCGGRLCGMPGSDFCPRCGAKMDGGAKDESVQCLD